jgi:hypothetical protein
MYCYYQKNAKGEQMMKRVLNHRFMIAFGILAMVTLGPPAMLPEAGAGAIKIEAAKVKSDPADLDAKEWSKAEPVTVTLDGAGQFEGKKKELIVKSVYTKKGKLSVWLSWEDSTKSLDGEAWVKQSDTWGRKPGSEDRVAINWEVRRIRNFATKGCAIVCHSDAKDPAEWKYHTAKAPQLGDLWVWESYRTDPAGFAGDYYVDDDSRKADQGSGLALKNINKFESGPVYMQDPNKTSPIPGMLMADQKMVIGDTAIAETQAWMMTSFSGDFAHIKAKSKHENGRWTVMMQRELTTGSDSDVKVNPKKDYSFGIAVFDNSGRHNSYNSPPLKLKF